MSQSLRGPDINQCPWPGGNMCRCPTAVPEQLPSLHRAHCLQRDSGSGIMPNASKWVPQGSAGFMTCPMALLCHNHLASDLAS